MPCLERCPQFRGILIEDVHVHIVYNIFPSTEVQNPRRKMQVALFAEPKTPLESSMSIIIL